MFHPSVLIFSTWLSMSIFLALSSDSLLLIWLMLEINLLCFLPMLISKKKNSSESAMKYFLIQSVSSLVLILSMSVSTLTESIISLFMVALLVKLGAAPCHQWVSPVFSGISWENIFIMSSVQKMIPLSLMFLSQSFKYSYCILALAVLSSCIVGAAGGLLQASLQKILAFSSIAHMAWMMIPSYLNNTIWLIYLGAYSLMMVSIISWLNWHQLSYISQIFNSPYKKEKMLVSMNLLSLGGLPPLTGFAPKLALLTETIQSPLNLLAGPLLVSTMISLSFYLRICILSIMTNSMNMVASTNSCYSTTYLFLNMAGLWLPPLFFIYL